MIGSVRPLLKAILACDPKLMRRLHGWLTIAWLVASVPIVIYLNQSIPFLVFISVYAVVASHWSAFQSTQVEVKQDAQIEKVEQEEHST